LENEQVSRPSHRFQPSCRLAQVAIPAALTLQLLAASAGAGCDLIPCVALDFRGALGSLDRPFDARGWITAPHDTN